MAAQKTDAQLAKQAVSEQSMSEVTISGLEQVVMGGDIKSLSPAQRISYYEMRCRAAGLDPRTSPFQYLELQGRLVLYATKAATDQLTKVNHLSSEIISEGETVVKGVEMYRVQVRISDKSERRTDDIGVVPFVAKGTNRSLSPEDIANIMMKTATKAKRRGVLAHCGLGMMDESEIETIPDARKVDINTLEPEPDPNIDIADTSMLERIEAKRKDAIGKGFTKPNGMKPAPLAPGITVAKATGAEKVLDKFLGEYKAPKPVPAATPVESDRAGATEGEVVGDDRLQELYTVKQDSAAFMTFNESVNAKKLNLQSDGDLVTMENAIITLGIDILSVHDLTDEQWPELAVLIDNDGLKW